MEMIVPFCRNPATVPGMKTMVWFLALATLVLPLDARPSRLDSDPEVVYLKDHLDKPFLVEVVKEAPLYSNQNGGLRLGSVKVGRKMQVVALTDKVFKVRGIGADKRTAGWAGSWAFEAGNPEALEQLEQLRQREVEVRALIDAGEIAVGMTLDEISQVRGKPTKTSVRKTGKGQSGRWEWVKYDQEKQYVTRVDPASGQVYRQFSHYTQIEKNRTVVEFEDGIVTAIEESKNRKAGGVRIVVPPVICGW